MKYTYKCFEDNAGCLHLAVLDDSGTCVYYLADQDRALIRETLDALRAGGDPIADGWEAGIPPTGSPRGTFGGCAFSCCSLPYMALLSGEPDPAACYVWIVDAVNRRNGGAEEIEL